MKKGLLLHLLLLPLVGLFAQQAPQYSNYVMNNYILNPAVGGSYTFWNAKMGHREQWVNMAGAPKTSFISFHGPLGHMHTKRNRTLSKKTRSYHHGVGGFVSLDRLGPFTWTSAYASYAFHMKLSKKVTGSMGVFAGVKEFKIDGDQIRFVEHKEDGLVKNGVSTSMLPDGSVGGMVYGDKFFAGLSVNQIFQSGLNYEAKDGSFKNGKLNNHYFITGGYKLNINRHWHFYPTVMVKYMRPAPVTFDINLRMMYEDFVWFGVLYRDRDAVALVAEYIINNTFEIGYAYDYDVANKLWRYNAGSHEIIIGIRWNDVKKEIRCAAKYW